MVPSPRVVLATGLVALTLVLSGCLAPTTPQGELPTPLRASLLLDLVPSPGEGSYPQDFVSFNGTIYFTARDPEDTDRRVLFYLDGTTAVRVDSTHRVYSPVTLYDGALYFLSYEPSTGTELFRCTTNNIVELAGEVRSGSTNGAYLFEGDRLTVYGDKLCFIGLVDASGVDHRELYAFDSSDDSLEQVSVFGLGSAEVNRLVAWNGYLYFFATPSDSLHDFAIYRWEDGVGVSAVSWASGNNNFGVRGSVPVVLGSRLWFWAEGPSVGTSALGAVNGEVDLFSLTTDGTFTREQDFAASAQGSEFSVVDGKAYFVVDPQATGDGPEWYQLTAAGALTRLANLNPAADRGSAAYLDSYDGPLATGFENAVVFGAGKAYDEDHNADDIELFRWTGSGTPQKVAEIGTGDGTLYPSSPHAFATFGDRVLFAADDGDHGVELWVLQRR